jgi:hypothetical protein
MWSSSFVLHGNGQPGLSGSSIPKAALIAVLARQIVPGDAGPPRLDAAPRRTVAAVLCLLNAARREEAAEAA